MTIRKLQEAWNQWGELDPMWAVLTSPDKAGRRWSAEEFFATGEREVADALGKLERLGISVASRRALDFGCGVGRLTQALGGRFELAVGVDIAPSMIAKAKELNRRGDRCEYVLNGERDLRCFESQTFDFVYSNITLQHMPRPLIRSYLAEFGRIVKPGGCLAFQLPAERDRGASGWKRVARALVPEPILDALFHWRIRWLAARSGKPVMEMYGIPKSKVERLLARAGFRCVGVEELRGEGSVWLSYWYYAVKC